MPATFGAVALALASAVLTAQAEACSFHNYKPAKTAVDWVLTGRSVVLARPDPNDVFSFRVTRVLKGDARISNPPFLIDSVTRAKLVRNQRDEVLFGVGEDGSWTRIAYVNEDYRRMLDGVLNRAPTWRGQDYHPERLVVFSEYLEHPDPALRRLALLEIDRAPYALLRQLETDISVEYLVRSLRARERYPYRPILALLLGLSGSVEARIVVNDYIDRVADWKWAEHLGPFATALIELEGTAAIARLEPFLSDPDQPLEKLESVVEALAIHHDLGSPSMREAVFDVLSAFASRRPGGTVLIARQFSKRQNWAFGPSLEPLLESGANLSSGNRLIVGAYVAQSRVNRRHPELVR